MSPHKVPVVNPDVQKGILILVSSKLTKNSFDKYVITCHIIMKTYLILNSVWIYVLKPITRKTNDDVGYT